MAPTETDDLSFEKNRLITSLTSSSETMMRRMTTHFVKRERAIGQRVTYLLPALLAGRTLEDPQVLQPDGQQ